MCEPRRRNREREGENSLQVLDARVVTPFIWGVFLQSPLKQTVSKEARVVHLIALCMDSLLLVASLTKLLSTERKMGKEGG